MKKNIQKSGMKQKINNIKTTLNIEEQEINEMSFRDEYLNESIKNNKSKELFNSKYINDVTKEKLKNTINENKDNEGMKEYCNLQIKYFENNPKIFSNEKFLSTIKYINIIYQKV